MPAIFNARDADSYEQMMGRWSRRLAPLFIEHAGVAAGERLLEVGRGTGSLTFTLARTAAFAELTAIDYADVYHLRVAYLAGAPDGPRSFAAVAWSCRGVVPGS